MISLALPAPASGCCYHCGDALAGTPVQARLAERLADFCCQGCAAAATWIAQANLGDYYQLRSQPGNRIDADALDFSAFDRDELMADQLRTVAEGVEVTVLTQNMHCAACAWLIDKALCQMPGVAEVSANALTGRIRLRFDPHQVKLSRLLEKLARIGYRCSLSSGEAAERARREARNRWLWRLGLAGLGAMQAMMFSEALYLDFAQEMSIPTRDFFRWLTFLVSTPVVFVSGWPFLAGMWREVQQCTLGMDTLIGGSTLLAYGASVQQTVVGGPHVWFDAAVMFVFLLLLARGLESRARSIARAQLDAYARALPALARRERSDGSIEQVPLTALQLGDVVQVSVGDALPADGVLLSAGAELDEALLTGEAKPLCKAVGDTVYAGAIVYGCAARLRLTAVGAQLRVSQLARLVESTQADRPQTQQLGARWASRFVAVQLVLAAVAYFWWAQVDPDRAFAIALSLLVISCPCALTLAIPATLTCAYSALARIGVLTIRPDALMRLTQIDQVAFDKTGTLSDGAPKIVQVATLGGLSAQHVSAIAAALQQGSLHPLALAFRSACPAPPAAQAVAVRPGVGLSGTVDGRLWHLGTAEFAAGRADDGRIWLGDGAQAVAAFSVREQPRPDAASAIARLHARGLGTQLLSGDGLSAVKDMADAVGISRASARLKPEDKLQRVRALQAQGHRVLMVGDGINDGPVLAGADVSVALGGVALAQQAADLVLIGGRLQRIADAIDIAWRARKLMRQNVGFALGYNLIAIPLALAGLVTPAVAAAAMALSSLAVTLNALRLHRRVSHG